MQRVYGMKNKQLKSEDGQATVEFALTIVFVMFLIVGIIEMSMLLYTYSVVADAAKEGVRYAVVHGNHNSSPSGPGSTSAIDGTVGTGVVKTYAQFSFHDTSTMTVTVTYPDTASPPANQSPNRVQVKVTYPYQPFFGLAWPTVNVYANAEGRIAF